MRTVSIANARGHLADLIDEVGSGHSVMITRRGREVARLVPSHRVGVPLPSRSAARRAMLETGGKVGRSVVSKLRDEERA